MLARPTTRASSPMTPVAGLSTAASNASVGEQKAGLAEDGRAAQAAAPANLDDPAVARPPSPSGPAAAPPAPPSFVPIPSFHLQPLAKRHNRERKAELAGQLPLAMGRRIAFRVKSKDEWILAIVRKNNANDVNRCVHARPLLRADARLLTSSRLSLQVRGRRPGDRGRRREVRPRPLGTSSPGTRADRDPPSLVLGRRTYHTNSLKNVIPLPTLGAPADSASHPSRFAPLSVGSLALALYPGTTTFYRGKVVGRELERPVEAPAGSKGKKRSRSRSVPEDEQRYLVAFDDDDNRLQTVEIGDIAEWPGGLADLA